MPSYLCNTKTKERKGKDRELVFAIPTTYRCLPRIGITMTRGPRSCSEICAAITGRHSHNMGPLNSFTKYPCELRLVDMSSAKLASAAICKA